jgi:hypothetical protein
MSVCKKCFDAFLVKFAKQQKYIYGCIPIALITKIQSPQNFRGSNLEMK